MTWAASIFLDVNLPNPTSWFYSALFLSIALFFRFDKVFSLRHLDLFLLFAWVPGLLLMLEQRQLDSEGINRWPYAWLLGATIVTIVRALIDLALVKRPAFVPNLNAAGLCWLAIALFGALVVVSVREPNQEGTPGQESSHRVQPPTAQFRERTEAIIQNRFPQAGDPTTTRLVAERGLALICHVATAVGLFMIGWRHFSHAASGVAAATTYLLLPYTFMLTPFNILNLGHWDSAFAMSLWVWAVFWMRRPFVSGLFLGLATGTAVSPLMILPAWCGFYWRRGMDRYLVGFLVTMLPCFFLFSETTSWVWSDWIPWLEPDSGTDSFWHGIHWAYRLPVFVLFLSLALLGFIWPDPKNLGQLIALNLSLLAGVELWQADRGGTHLFSFLAPLILMVFRPTLEGCHPPLAKEIWFDQLQALLLRWFASFARGFYSIWRIWAGPSLVSSGSESQSRPDSKVRDAQALNKSKDSAEGS